ncbi:hypothetical protein L6164_035545 [Bauhinia variegata]|uniref:Uncharacterized protein n=1 Tax=Bauhinia variegata TaxID=167791 RepID=A0ACB9KE94_BAUVA|nr:hypothetical protein L6164_035545 [Bauhinia variegata]
MASMETSTNNSSHSRSNSVPSAPHPFISQFTEHLGRLMASEATSSSSISQRLNGLWDLHDCIDKLLQLPFTQQSLARECSDKWVNDLLEGSLRLLDICSAAKDALLQSKEMMYELQSIFRRRRVGESAFTMEGGKYLTSRKKVKKTIRKALEDLKGIKKECILSSSNRDNEAFSIISILQEVETVTLSSFEALLLFISGSEVQSKQNRWFAITKLRQHRRVACDSQESTMNEFEKLDAALQSLISHKSSSLENYQNHMENLELCIQDLEARVENVQRQLIRTRVSLLNIYNH